MMTVTRWRKNSRNLPEPIRGIKRYRMPDPKNREKQFNSPIYHAIVIGGGPTKVARKMLELGPLKNRKMTHQHVRGFIENDHVPAWWLRRFIIATGASMDELLMYMEKTAGTYFVACATE